MAASPLIWCAIALGVFFRLAFLGSDSLWLDEAYSVTVVLQHSARDIWHGAVDPNHPPLFFIILRGALRLLGTSEVAARLPSALASLASLALTYVLGRRLGMSREASVVGVALLALAPLDIWYAQEARMYAMVTTSALLVAVSLTFTGWMGAGFTALSLAAGLYVDFTMVPLALAILSLWLVRWWQGDRGLARLAGVSVAYVAAWCAFYPRWGHFTQVMNRIDTVPLFVRLRESAGLDLPSGTPALVLVAFAVVLVGVAGAVASRAFTSSPGRRSWAWAVWFLFVVSTIAAVVPRAYSVKQFAATGWPFVILFVAWTLAEARRLHRPRLLVAIGVSMLSAVLTVATPRADWRGVAAHLNSRSDRTEAVWLDPPWNRYAYDYYSSAAPAGHGDICMVAERFGRTPPTSGSEAWLDQHLRLVDSTDFWRLQVRCYSR